jgi:hypothetical protein
MRLMRGIKGRYGCRASDMVFWTLCLRRCNQTECEGRDVQAPYLSPGFSDLKNQQTWNYVMFIAETTTLFVADTRIIYRGKYVKQINSDNTGAGSGIRSVWIGCVS